MGVVGDAWFGAGLPVPNTALPVTDSGELLVPSVWSCWALLLPSCDMPAQMKALRRLQELPDPEGGGTEASALANVSMRRDAVQLATPLLTCIWPV